MDTPQTSTDPQEPPGSVVGRTLTPVVGGRYPQGVESLPRRPEGPKVTTSRSVAELTSERPLRLGLHGRFDPKAGSL